jgi:hypothetical protein
MPIHMPSLSRRVLGACLFAAALGASLPALAQTRSVAYAAARNDTPAAYLVDWIGSTRAVLVGNAGRSSGSVVRSGPQRVVTLDTPWSIDYQSGAVDPCIGDVPRLRQSTLQVALTTLSGSADRGESKVVELGTITTLNGCAAGTTVPFGALADPGLATRHLALALRPSVADLVPGVALAGPGELPRTGTFEAVDVLTLQAGGLGSFAASGSVVPAAFDADQWLVLGLPSGERAYTRLSVDRRTGAEIWLDVDRTGGVPTVAFRRLMVKPVAGASFGTLRQASRMWQSGISTTPTNSFLVHLYRDGSGERVFRDLVAGTETRSPLTWTLGGGQIVQSRPLGPGTGVRTWVPLANGGGGATFVMESEVIVDPAGGVTPLIAPRVNFYTDTGPATAP